MHKSIAEGVDFVAKVKDALQGTEVEPVICAPFTMLKDLKQAAAGTNIRIGAQNMHYEESGAFTGEIAPSMLAELKVDYVIIGHSERRQYYNETDESVNRKAKQALAHGIIPIICVGESLKQREEGSTKEIVGNQTKKALEGLSGTEVKSLVIAYEPIWAIGTGKTATAAQANEVIAYIREVVKELCSEEVSEEIRIQYGGSVKPSNVEEIMNESDIDGALVGGASLQPEDFVSLVNF